MAKLSNDQPLLNWVLLQWIHRNFKESEVTQSYPTLCDPMNCRSPGSSIHGILGKSTGVGCDSLLQGIFPTQGWNLGLLHCGQTPYSLSHQAVLKTVKAINTKQQNSPSPLDWALQPSTELPKAQIPNTVPKEHDGPSWAAAVCILVTIPDELILHVQGLPFEKQSYRA